MRRFKKILTALVMVLTFAAFSTTSVMAATPRTMLTYDVTSYTPSGRVCLTAKITVNDTENIVIGSQGITSYGWVNYVKEESIRWTSVSIAADNSYAYCAVSYTTAFGNSYTETIRFYP